MTDAAMDRLFQAIDLAKNHQGNWRAMRVTLECGHYRLMSYQGTVMGIGARTNCYVCPPTGTYTTSDDVEHDRPADRLVVNVEETGTLSEEYHERVRKGWAV